MNDIHVSSDIFEFILFADDTNLSSTLRTFASNNLSNDINYELNKISDWLIVNKLSLNIKKTKFMVFHHRQKVLTENMIPELAINNTIIERVKEFDFLGLTLNENMDWSSHCHKIANKISRILGVMNRLKHYLPTSVLTTIYNSLILSHLQYCLTVWGYEHNRLTKLQKRAIRIISCNKYNAHSEPILKNLKLLKLEDLLKVRCLKLYYKFHHGTLPVYFSTFFITNSTIHNYPTRDCNKLHVFKTKTQHASRCIRHYIPNLVNSTPDTILSKINSHSFEGFGKYIKHYFLQNYSSDCVKQNCYVCNKK